MRFKGIADFKKPIDAVRGKPGLLFDPFKIQMNKDKFYLRGLVRTLGPGNKLILAYTDVDGIPTGIIWVIQVVVDENGIEQLVEEVDLNKLIGSDDTAELIK